MRRYFGKEWVLGSIVSLLLLVVASGSMVAGVNGWLFDVGQSLGRPPANPTAGTVIIHLDPQSLAELGGSQQERQGLVLLLEKLRYVKGDVSILIPLNESQKNPALDSLASIQETIDTAGLSAKAKHHLSTKLNKEIAALDTDSRLVTAMGRMKHVILPQRLDDAGTGAESPKPSISSIFASGLSPLQPASTLIADDIRTPIAEFSKHASALGTFELLADGQNNIRGFRLMQPSDSGDRLSIPLLLAAGKRGVGSASGEISYGKATVKSGRFFQGYFRVYSGLTFTTYTLSQILSGEIDIKKMNGDTIIVANHAMLEHRYTVSGDTELNAAEMVALATINLKKRDLLTTTDLFAVGEWAIYLLTVILIVLVMPYLRYAYCVAVSVATLLLLAGVSVYFLLTQQLWLKTGAAILLLFIGVAVIGLRRLYTSQSARHYSDVAQTLRQLGLAYQEQGKKEQAFEAFKKLPPADENLELIYNLALDFERQRRYERAAAAYLHILHENPAFKDTAKRWQNAEKMGVAALTSSGQFSHAVLLMPDADGQKPRLGRYEVEKEIGKGAMGAVYLGRDPKIDRTVAIKTLALSQEFAPEEIKEVEGRFFHEASAAGKLNHPNIVTIYDAGEEHDLAYIAMEYLDGNPLSDYVRASKLLPVPTVLDIMAQVADGINYADKAGVVHRDIKPANIMYNPKSGVVKITDFGIARLTSSSRTKTGTILGTPSFMSPEQISSQKVDGRTDIFSLGATMFVLLTGKRPFDADSLAGLTFQITSEKHRDPLKLRPELPACVKTVIDKAMQKEPENRYQDGHAMRRAILRCLKKME